MLCSLFFVHTLLLVSCLAHGRPRKESDLSILTNKVEKLAKSLDLNSQVTEQLQVALNNQGVKIEQQAREIVQLKQLVSEQRSNVEDEKKVNSDLKEEIGKLKLKMDRLEFLLVSINETSQPNLTAVSSIANQEINNVQLNSTDSGVALIPESLPSLKEKLKAPSEIQQELTEMFEEYEKYGWKETRTGKWIKEFGLDWMDQETRYRQAPKVLLELCSNYEGDDLLDIIKEFVSAGIDVSKKKDYGMNALHLVCRSQSKNDELLEIVKYLISVGIDVNQTDHIGRNALILVCGYYENDNLLEIVKYLISVGMDVNHKDRSRLNALQTLKYNKKNENRQDIIKMLQ